MPDINTPDHRTYEQRILAVLEDILVGQREVLNAILGIPGYQLPSAKPKGRK